MYRSVAGADAIGAPPPPLANWITKLKKHFFDAIYNVLNVENNW